LVSTRVMRRRDEALSKDEAEAASSYWLHGREACHVMVTSTGVEEATSGKGNGEDDVNWADMNLTGKK
jgi:hypothetical protein